MEVKTGFGYFTDSNGRITDKAQLPIGSHPLSDGYTYTEVATQEELDKIEVYVPPVSPIDAFNADAFLVSIMEAFSPLESYASVMNYYQYISDFAKAKGFSYMRDFLKARVVAGSITQEQYDMVNSILDLQGIDLDNLPEE